MKYVCTRACFHKGQLFEVGDPLVTVGGEKVPEHFAPVATDAEPGGESAESLGRLKVDDLKALAAERGVALPEGAKKAEIVEALLAATPDPGGAGGEGDGQPQG